MMDTNAISDINKGKRNSTINHSSIFPVRVAMDVNDIKFEFGTLIIDENDVIEK